MVRQADARIKRSTRKCKAYLRELSLPDQLIDGSLDVHTSDEHRLAS